jgi:uncharacterized protein YukE
MLGDPLEGLSLPPGDPESLRSAVVSFSSAAESLDATGQRQRTAVGQLSGTAWKGAAAESARSATGRVLDAFRTASSLAHDACDALSQCANDWQDAANQWQQARYLADEAVAEEAAVVKAAVLGVTQNPKALDYQSPDRGTARKLGQEAIDRFNSASRRVTNRLDDLSSKVIASPAFLPVYHHSTPWYDAPMHWADDAINAVGGAFSAAWNTVSSDPGAIAKDGLDLLGLVGSAGLVAMGGVAESGGVALDLTGAGAVVGVPLNMVGIAAIGTGVAGTAYFGDDLAKDLSTHQASAAEKGADRGDGRDYLGHFTKEGGPYGATAEERGLVQYEDDTGRLVFRDRVRATLPDGSTRYYDGLSPNPDGTFVGVEVKSGAGGRDAAQRIFDAQVDQGTPATARLNGVVIKIVSTDLVKVPSE